MQQFATSKFQDDLLSLGELEFADPSSGDPLHLFEMSPVPALIIDRDLDFVAVNQSASDFLCYEPGELEAANLSKIIRSNGSVNAARAFLSGSEKRAEWEFLRKDNVRVWGEVVASSLPDGGWLLFVSDIAERHRATDALLISEERRWQAQKIEALERLAGGIAHDFNNLLAVILLQTEMLNLQLGPDSPLVRRVDEIMAVSNDAAAIVRQLLAFGRKLPMNPSAVVLNPVIEEFCRNLAIHVGDHIDSVLSLDPSLGNCSVDCNQIVQALTFLAANAKEAMPDGGTLRVETKNVVIDAATAHKSQPGGPYVQITVSDNGVGMNPQTERHIFEPFFSTKESEKGAGLSLATVYGIVKQSGGFIWVESQVGGGTSFKIQFPRVDSPQAETPINPEELTAGGYETVLLVDDDKPVRRIAAEVLRAAGYDVIEAKSGMEALEFAQAYQKTIHLLLTDYSMPQMNGNATAEGVLKLHPETSVLFMSGSPREIAQAGEKSEKKIQFLGKPFSSSGLMLKVRTALGDRAITTEC